MPSGGRLVRVFDPRDPYFTGALAFRANGPRARFDHHPGRDENGRVGPTDHPTRAVWYACPEVEVITALLEVFGQDGVLDDACEVVEVELVEPLRLLELVGDGAPAAGTVVALTKQAHVRCWPWARYFYEQPVYGKVDGLTWSGFYNERRCLVLFERAKHKLSRVDVRPLSDVRYHDQVMMTRVVLARLARPS